MCPPYRLSIVKDFVALHGGSVHIEDAPGLYEESGERIIEDFGMKTGPAGQKQAADVAPDAPLILVVDDNPDMNAFETQLLGRKYRVASAFDGEEGLRMALEMGARPDRQRRDDAADERRPHGAGSAPSPGDG